MKSEQSDKQSWMDDLSKVFEMISANQKELELRNQQLKHELELQEQHEFEREQVMRHQLELLKN